MTCRRLAEDIIEKVAQACSELPVSQGNYLEDDALRVCILAVVDFQMTEKAVLRATRHFEESGAPTFGLQTLDDLDGFLAEHPDDRQAAQLLWGYNLHTRAGMLRDLVRYFLNYKSQHGFVSDMEALRHWAQHADFHADFEGRVKGLGIKTFTMAQQRLGVPTVVPDSRVKNFLASRLGVELSDECAVRILNTAADRIGRPRTELDWSIWELDKSRPVNV